MVSGIEIALAISALQNSYHHQGFFRLDSIHKNIVKSLSLGFISS